MKAIEHRWQAALELDLARQRLLAAARELDGIDTEGHHRVLLLLAQTDDALAWLAQKEKARVGS